MRWLGVVMIGGSLVGVPVLASAGGPTKISAPPAAGGSGSATATDTDTDTATDTDATATDTDTDTATDTDATATDTDATATDTDPPTTATDTDTPTSGTTGDSSSTSNSTSVSTSDDTSFGSSSSDGDSANDPLYPHVGCDEDLDDSDPGCCDSEENNSDNFLCAVGARRDRVILFVVLVLLGRPRKRRKVSR